MVAAGDVVCGDLAAAEDLADLAAAHDHDSVADPDELFVVGRADQDR